MLLAITGQSAITGHRHWILRIGKLRPKAGVAAQGHSESGTEVTASHSPTLSFPSVSPVPLGRPPEGCSPQL